MKTPVIKAWKRISFNETPVYIHPRAPLSVRNDSELYGECIAGAMEQSRFFFHAGVCPGPMPP